jgi:prepilin-type N-terminal cleavage/methylation domain-containing protein
MKKGFSLVEVVLSVALLAVFLPAFIHLFSFSTFATSQGEKFTKAHAIAQEQMEAVIFLKNEGGSDWDWTSKPVDTASGQNYQPQFSAGTWDLGPIQSSEPLPVDGYTKKVGIRRILRCGVTICEFGAPDNFSREVTVIVGWTENGKDQEVELKTLVTRI